MNPHGVTKAQVGLGSVDNTSDANKPVSSATSTALSAKISKGELVVNVKDHGALGNGTANDRPAIQAAIDSCSSNGGGIVYFPPGTYVVSSPTVTKSNVTYLGAGVPSLIRTNFNGHTFINGTDPMSDVVFDGLHFAGPVNNTVSAPTRARTVSGPGTDVAIWIEGSLSPNDGAHAVVKNVTVRNCVFRNTTWLPIRLFGITRKTVVAQCEFTNCMDAGWASMRRSFARTITHTCPQIMD